MKQVPTAQVQVNLASIENVPKFKALFKRFIKQLGLNY